MLGRLIPIWVRPGLAAFFGHMSAFILTQRDDPVLGAVLGGWALVQIALIFEYLTVPHTGRHVRC